MVGKYQQTHAKPQGKDVVHTPEEHDEYIIFKCGLDRLVVAIVAMNSQCLWTPVLCG